jgi:hypothetical protein
VPPLADPAIALSQQQIGAVHFAQDGDYPTGGQGDPVDGLECGVMDETYHVHTHLSFFLNGDQLALPAQVGIVPWPGGAARCHYSLHTHDQSGKIHVEAAAKQLFTLGMFFDIWGQPLDSTTVADWTGMPIRVFILEKDQTAATEYTGAIRDIELLSHREITIQIGTDIPAIPHYTWDGE